MIGMTAKMEGHDALVSAFRQIRAKVAASDAAELAKGADELVRMAKAAAPVDEHDLQATVRKIEKAPNKMLVVAGGEKTRRAVKDGQSGTYDYARAQEFGTQDMAANPFFFPAYRRLKKRLRSRITRARKKIIAEALT